ncbi:MAG: ABC transporter ATP-binding protein [Dehalococcoidia bacterium]|nr:ABC transporter ATP-binding protein [Dehalococcoidia bacterium]
MDSDGPIVELVHVQARYGLVVALDDMSFSVGRGEIAALIGPHGAGKSAALKAICGLLPVTGGEIRFQGIAVNGVPMERLVAAGIAYVDEKRLIFPSMSVSDNLLLGAYRRRGKGGAMKADLSTVFQLFPVLQERLGQTAGTLSGGEKQMLAIGRAFMSRPKLLLLDCPSLRLAPILVRKVMGAISELREHGITTLLVEQNVKAVSHIADRGYFLERGRVVASGSPAELLSRSKSSRLVS